MILEGAPEDLVPHDETRFLRCIFLVLHVHWSTRKASVTAVATWLHEGATFKADIAEPSIYICIHVYIFIHIYVLPITGCLKLKMKLRTKCLKLEGSWSRQPLLWFPPRNRENRFQPILFAPLLTFPSHRSTSLRFLHPCHLTIAHPIRPNSNCSWKSFFLIFAYV